jgi:tRNA pseudouridine55 synthase
MKLSKPCGRHWRRWPGPAPEALSLDGLLVVDKPAGPTSHDVVARCRRLLSEKRVGHGGTLDPDATGVLLVAVGRVTRLLRFLSPLTKIYQGELVLGTATDTLDASGRVTGTWDMSAVTPAEVTAAARALTGDLLQIPPMVSAVQVGGRRLHQLARQGIEVERQPRPVRVERFDVTSPAADADRYRFLVECSSGTYVRSLVDDLGRALGGGAHLGTLRRTAVGPFGENRAVGLDQVGSEHLLTPLAAVGHLPRLALSPESLALARHGRPLDAAAAGASGTGPWAATDAQGGLVGVYEAGTGGVMRPAVILQPA